MSLQTFFLLKEDGGFLLQENGGKIIIDQVLVPVGGSSGGSSKAVGVSLVKKQLGDRAVEKFHHVIKGKLLIHTTFNVTSQVKPKVIQRLIPEARVFSKLHTKESCIVTSKLITRESFATKSKLFFKESCVTRSVVVRHPLLDVSEQLKLIRKDAEKTNQLTIELHKTKRKLALMEIQRVLLEDIRKVHTIKIDLNGIIHQRGDLMRITASMNLQSGQIWMRIIDSKGMIVQKAGLVKTNATGFQILVGTRDLKSGSYTVQVSNHANFSPLGVAEFQVKGSSPILPFVPVIPFLLTPDSPEKFEKVRFKTMQDSKVDATCKVFENKVFNIKDSNLPIPPFHFNCRCWLEGEE